MRDVAIGPARFGNCLPLALIAGPCAIESRAPALETAEALTAMMLSVFHVHGVIPGPKLFETQPHFLQSLFIVLLIINLLVVVFLKLSSRCLVQMVRVPSRYLGVSVLALSLVGVYSLRASLIDCAVAAAFGMLGFVLRRLDLPLVPLVLGMVLGRIMEEKFRASLARVDTPLDFRATFHSDSIGGDHNYSAYRNPEVDRLIERYNARLDPLTGVTELHRLQRILHDDQPILALWEPLGLAAFHTDLESVTPNALSPLANLEDWAWR